jgi:uncharacterized protein (UPF0261 family)
MTATIAILGSLDTKGPETAYMAQEVRRRGAIPLVIDTSAGADAAGDRNPDVSVADLLAPLGVAVADLHAMDRAGAVRTMAEAARRRVAALAADGKVDGLLAAGGSNAALVFARTAEVLPFGLPKVAVTTMAVVDARAVVGDADVTLIYPVADVDGLNSLTGTTLAQAAAAVVAMAKVDPWAHSGDGAPVAATMFGVTTRCVQAVRAELEAAGEEVIVFHANGTGGRSLEALADGGALAAVLDITTTELADLEAGGELSAGEGRLSGDRAPGVPRVVVPGAVDMVNFGPPDRVPTAFAGRLVHVHNDNVTLVRTTREENHRIGRRIGRYAAQRADSIVVLPLRGVSALDVAGGPFEDPDADQALFDVITELVPADRLRVIDAHINDPSFAVAVTAALGGLRTALTS